MPGDTPPKDVTKGMVVGLKQEVYNKKHAEKKLGFWAVFRWFYTQKHGATKMLFLKKWVPATTIGFLVDHVCCDVTLSVESVLVYNLAMM